MLRCLKKFGEDCMNWKQETSNKKRGIFSVHVLFGQTLTQCNAASLD